MVRLKILIVVMLGIIWSADRAYAAEPTPDVTYNLNFADYPGGPPLPWLAKKGFVPKRDADNQNKVVYSVTDQSLVLETKRQAFGLLLNEDNVINYSKVRIQWGVHAFPPGASVRRSQKRGRSCSTSSSATRSSRAVRC